MNDSTTIAKLRRNPIACTNCRKRKVRCQPVGEDICERCLEKQLICKREPVGQSSTPSPTMTSEALNTSPDHVQTGAQTSHYTSSHSTHSSTHAGTYEHGQTSAYDTSEQSSTGPWTYNQQPSPIPAYSPQTSQGSPHYNQYQYTAPPQPTPVQQYYPNPAIVPPGYPVYDGTPSMITQQPSVYPSSTVYYADSRPQAYTHRCECNQYGVCRCGYGRQHFSAP